MKFLTTDCTDATDKAAGTSHGWVHLILMIGLFSENPCYP